MNSLSLPLLDEILFRLNPKSVGMMRCINKAMESHISNDPKFKSEYLSRVRSSLLHISTYGSTLLCFHPLGDDRLFLNEDSLKSKCYVLGYCSGLLLLLIDGCFCVANPLTKKFRFLNRSVLGKPNCVGFAVDQIDPTTQGFKVVRITAVNSSIPNKMMYKFEIYAGGSWRVSNTKITCVSSNLKDMKPVYFDGALHWLRDDESIITFNPEAQKARLIIPRKPQPELSTKLLLTASDNKLTLISATEETIFVFTLESILTDPKWILARQIRNEVVNQSSTLFCWDVEAFDGECLVVRTMDNVENDRVAHGYDLRANKWGVVGSMPSWCDGSRDFYQYKPSWSSVIGLLDQDGPNRWTFTVVKSDGVLAVEGIMGLINRNL